MVVRFLNEGLGLELNCKMIECSNEQSAGIVYLSEIDILSIDRYGFWFKDLRSSVLKNIEFKEDLVIITTLNTIYTFQMV